MKTLYHTNYADATNFEGNLQLYDTVLAVVIGTTRKGVILRFNGNQEGFAYGGYAINTKVLASIQKIRDGFTPRLSVDSVIAYPGAA